MDPESTLHSNNAQSSSAIPSSAQHSLQSQNNREFVVHSGFNLYRPHRADNTNSPTHYHSGSLNLGRNVSGGSGNNKHARSATIDTIKTNSFDRGRIPNYESCNTDSHSPTTSSNSSPPSTFLMQPHPQIHRGYSRKIKSISSFMQIGVNIPPYVSLLLTIDKGLSIERLATQIEAEYAFKFSGICQNYEPLEVGALYDVGMIPLNFEDTVGDVLEHGDVVNVLNVYKDDDSVVDDTGDLSDFACELDICPAWYSSLIDHPNWAQDKAEITSTDRETSPQETQYQIKKILSQADRRLRSVLSNTLAIAHFQKFTVREYSVENLLFWLDVELFAAGVSDTSEDNYFDENQSAVIHAKYIYLTYVHSQAPLQVNISDEIKKSVPWPLEDDCVLDRRMFDEAKESVYQLMKGHIFSRFEESEEWKACEKVKTEDPELYASHEMTATIDKYFKPNMSLMLAVTMALDNGVEGTPISLHYKEQTLHSMLSQYFPETPFNNTYERVRPISIASHVVKGYFNCENRLTSSQRMRRIKKERKLQWVFGEKSSRFDGQLVDVPDADLVEDDDGKSIVSEISETRKVTKDVWNRKKKAEKLEAIFGRELTNSQLISQHILKKTEDNVDGDKIMKEKQNDQEVERNLNELSPRERRALLKSTRKLQLVLGQPLNGDVVRQALTRPTIESTSASSPTNFSVYDHTPRTTDGSTYVRRISRRASDPMPPSPSLSVASASQGQAMFSRPRSGSFDSTNYSLSDVPLLVVDKDSKEYRRKKLQKLYRFLGEKVPVNVVLAVT